MLNRILYACSESCSSPQKLIIHQRFPDIFLHQAVDWSPFEAIEGSRHAHTVGTNNFKDQPVTHLKQNIKNQIETENPKLST